VLTPLFNPLRCFAAAKVFISETTVNKHKEAFACSGQGRAAQNLKAPPMLTRGPRTSPFWNHNKKTSGIKTPHKRSTVPTPHN
ncbi:hypothetical protein MMN78_26500, partial [Escherichia coli]|nr:hypothetical protein [Escherichia coli]